MMIYGLKVETLQMHWVMKIHQRLLGCDDNMPINELLTVSKGMSNSDIPSKINYQRSTIYVNESGLYTLIFKSKLESAMGYK